MSTPNSPYPPGQQGPGGQDGYQQGQYQQGPYQQPQYQQAPYADGQYPQAGPYGAMPQGPYLQPGYGVPFGPDGYLHGGPVGFGDAIKLAFQNAFTYQGRASRSAYWWFALFSLIVSFVVDFVFGGVSGALAGNSSGATVVGLGISGLVALASLTMFVVELPLFIRRLHDIDRSGWWLLIGLIPVAGAITLFVFSVLEGTRGPNRFGG